MAIAMASSIAPQATAPDASLRRLTAAERVTYDALGYVVIPDVISPEELEAIDREIDRLTEKLLAERREKGDAPGTQYLEETGTILQLGMRSPLCQQVAEDERVLALIEDIVKPGIAIYSIKLIAKAPFSDFPCHWHQDDAYYVASSESQTRMSVWLPLQDAHVQNGCLWVVPESHRWGLQQHARKSYGLCRLSMDEAEIEAVLQEKAIPVPVQAGSAVLFSALLWHGSRGNQTGKVRRAFITSYQEATVPRGAGAQWRIVRPAA